MAIVVAKHGASLVIAGPVATGMFAFFPRKIGCSIGFGAGQDIMLVGLVAPTLDLHAVFIKSCTLDQVRTDMQLIQITGDQAALGIIPGALADPVTGRSATFVREPGGKISAPGPFF